MLRLIILFFCFTLPIWGAEPTVLVTILPYKFFVEKIAGKTVQVEVLVPPGVSEHTFEPTIRQALRIADAAIWFRIGEPIEERLADALKSQTPHMRMVDLRDGLALLPISSEEGCGCTHHHGYDPHIWLSPQLMIQQTEQIAKELQDKYPHHREEYRQASEKFVIELLALDAQIKEILAPLKKRVMMVSHPAYGYFCHDYQLKQIAIEIAGKEPSPQQLTLLLNKARELCVKTIFTQIQHPIKGSQLLAQQLQATQISFDPLAENYSANMLKLAHLIARSE